MKLNLDHIERVARAAKERVPGRWYAGNAPDECRDSVYADDDGTPIAEVADMLDRQIAEHIAASSPDVVLALVERIRAAEERVFQLEWKMKHLRESGKL